MKPQHVERIPSRILAPALLVLLEIFVCATVSVPHESLDPKPSLESQMVKLLRNTVGTIESETANLFVCVENQTEQVVLHVHRQDFVWMCCYDLSTWPMVESLPNIAIHRWRHLLV